MTTVPAVNWRTSSYSGNASGNCVEVAIRSDEVHVRDTKHRNGGTQTYPTPAWKALLTSLRHT